MDKLLANCLQTSLANKNAVEYRSVIGVCRSNIFLWKFRRNTLYIRIFLAFIRQKHKKQKTKGKKQETRSKKHIVDEP